MTHLTLARCLASLRGPALTGLVMLTGACETERLNSSAEPESAPLTGSLSTARPSFAASSSTGGVPFGFWRLEYSQLGSDFTSLQANGSPNSILRNLEIARSRGARVFIRFAGSSSERYRNGDGSFSLSKFQALLDQFKNINLDSYIADGTLAGHMMLDEPSDGSNWNGRTIPFQTLEDAAKHSKSLWPTLPTFVRSVPTWLAGASFRWQYLDGGWAQYSARKGQVDSYRDAEVRAANEQGLKVVWGLNSLNGGDGSSQKRFGASTHYSMSATELLKYGRSLLGASNSCGFLMWMYESNHMGSSGVLDAVKTLSAEAKNRSSSCGGEGGGVPEEEPPPPQLENVEPVASFTGSCSDLSCEFIDVSTDPNGNETIVTRSWNYGDGTEGNIASHVYSGAGPYTVTLTVTDDKGATSVFFDEVTPSDPPVVVPTENLAPLASFDVVGCGGLTCTFTDRSSDIDGSIVSRSWDFGGSTSGSGTSRTYGSAGAYMVTLTVADDDGASSTVSKEVSVTAPVPTPSRRRPWALFGSSCRTRTCTFSDRSKANDSKIERWRWSFGNGATSSSRNPSYKYSRKGTYRVLLTVTDSDGDSSNISHRVTAR